MPRRTDAGSQQNLGRSDGARRQDYLPPRHDLQRLAAAQQSYAARRPAFQNEAVGKTIRQHRQIGAPLRRLQKSRRGRIPPPVPLRHLAVAHPIRVRAVEIRAFGNLQQPRRFDETHRGRIARAEIGDVQQPARPVIGRIPPNLIIFGAHEIRQHFPKRPARIAGALPIVIIPGISPHIDHAVDGTGPAQHLAARRVDAPVARMRLRHRGETPVQALMFEQPQQPQRDMDQGIRVTRTGFDQADLIARVLGKTVGQHATRRARAHDDIVELKFLSRAVHGGFFYHCRYVP